MDIIFTKSSLYRGSVTIKVHVVAFHTEGPETVLEFLANNDEHADKLGEEAILIVNGETHV